MSKNVKRFIAYVTNRSGIGHEWPWCTDLTSRQGIDTLSTIHEDNPFNIDVADGAERWAERFGVAVVCWLESLNFMYSLTAGEMMHALRRDQRPAENTFSAENRTATGVS